MLATKSLRFATARYIHPAQCAWASKARIVPMLQPVAMKWIVKPLSSPSYSKDAKSAETPPKENIIPSSDDNSFTAKLTTSSSSSTSTSKSLPSCSSGLTNDAKTKNNICSTGSLGETGVKLPNKEQIESFVFKFLVNLWDFAFYVFCLSRKLIETYVFNNPTVQHYWKKLLKRMDDARKEIK